MKIIIVMTYYDRQFQLNKTLESIRHTEHDDFEVIIVDDCSKTSPDIAGYNFSIDLYKTKNKRWIDGSPAYNLGILKALEKNPDIIILQSAEAYHVGDIIKYASKVINKNYISFACFNLSKSETFRDHNIKEIVRDFNNHAVNNEDNAWLNHKVIRQMGYHWCSAITTENIVKLNGFDERFSDGYCFEDDELLARIKILGLNVEITDYPFVVHQWHERNYVPANWKHLFNRNRLRFETIQQNNSFIALHHFTPDFEI